MHDLTGLGKVAEVILDKIAAVTGTLYAPIQIKRLGKANAEVAADAILVKTEAEFKVELLKRNQQRTLTEIDENDSNLRLRAGKRVLEQELWRQRNIEQIIEESLKYIESSSENEVQARDIETDWMDAFIRYSQDISTDGVRELWSKILANQASEGCPVISKVTLDALRLLEPSQAKVFERVAQMFMGMGLVMEIDPLGESDQSLNINTMEVLALEDIGFVKRVHVGETTLDLRDGIFSFWSDFAQAPGPATVNDTAIKPREWNNDDDSRFYVLRTIKEITSKGLRDSSGLRKEIKIDRLQLTSRGFELAAIIYPEFNQIIGLKDISGSVQAGKYSNNKFREEVILEWVSHFARMGVVVIRNEAKSIESLVDRSKTVLTAVFIYDSINSEWSKIK